MLISFSVNRDTTFLMKVFQQNNNMNIKVNGKLLELIFMYQQFLIWMGIARVSPTSEPSPESRQ